MPRVAAVTLAESTAVEAERAAQVAEQLAESASQPTESSAAAFQVREEHVDAWRDALTNVKDYWYVAQTWSGSRKRPSLAARFAVTPLQHSRPSKTMNPRRPCSATRRCLGLRSSRHFTWSAINNREDAMGAAQGRTSHQPNFQNVMVARQKLNQQCRATPSPRPLSWRTRRLQ